MSFGFDPLSDPITAGALAWKLFSNMKQAPQDFADMSSQVETMARFLDNIGDVTAQQVLTALERNDVCRDVKNARKVLEDMDKLLKACSKLREPGIKLWSRFVMTAASKDTLRRRFSEALKALEILHSHLNWSVKDCTRHVNTYTYTLSAGRVPYKSDWSKNTTSKSRMRIRLSGRRRI